MRKNSRLLISAYISALMLAGGAQAGDTPSPAGAEVYFVNLKDNDTVSSPLTVVFGLKGMGVAPAGVDLAKFPNVGHHHLFVDAPLTKEIEKDGIPADKNHIHFGKGQTEAEIKLEPGKHVLQLVFADPSHVPHNPVVVSKPITVNVK